MNHQQGANLARRWRLWPIARDFYQTRTYIYICISFSPISPLPAAFLRKGIQFILARSRYRPTARNVWFFPPPRPQAQTAGHLLCLQPRVIQPGSSFVLRAIATIALPSSHLLLWYGKAPHWAFSISWLRLSIINRLLFTSANIHIRRVHRLIICDPLITCFDFSFPFLWGHKVSIQATWLLLMLGIL